VYWLLQQGHEVFLIHPKIDNQYPEVIRNRPMPGLDELQSFPGFSAYAYPTKPLIFSKTYPEPQSYKHWSDTKLLEKFQPDVVVVEDAVHMTGFCSLFWGGYKRPIGTEYARRTGTPTILLFHTDWIAYAGYYIGNWVFKLFNPILCVLIKRFSGAYDVNYFPSRQQLAKYRAMKAQSSEYLAYQGINCQKFHPRNICYDPIPEDHRPTLLFVGRIAPEKNVTQLLDAFPIIAAKIPDVHLVIVGRGPQDKEVRRRAAKLGSGITMWGESMGEELKGWFARADLFVNPSVTENLCTTNMEALASGIPVVAAGAGGNVEQVVHGHNGFLSEPNNPTDLAEKVIAILKDANLKEEMSRQARSSVLEFDWSACMERFEERLYELAPHSDAGLSIRDDKQSPQSQVSSPKWNSTGTSPSPI
jgi:glycosyltransferase involved in cell wall biosynthesis